MLRMESVFPIQDQRIVGGSDPFVAWRGSRGDEVVRSREKKRMERRKSIMFSGCLVIRVQKILVLLNVGLAYCNLQEICG
jgi:hypothetical protein